jgi:aminodeoxyfutalosine synthase
MSARAIRRAGGLLRERKIQVSLMVRAVKVDLAVVREKVLGGERLSSEDGLFLYRPDVPLGEVAELANFVREKKNGNLGFYNINTHLNPTNVCVYRCTFVRFVRICGTRRVT